MSPHDDLTDRLRRAGGSPDGGRSELDDLRRRLAAAADDDGLVQVGYRTVDSPLGRLLVAATGAGLVRVAFEAEDHDVVLQELADRIGPRVLRLPSRTDLVARQLDEYFAGRRHGFSVELDLQLVRGFRRDVVVGLVDIPYGRTESYAQVAARAGRPSAVRAVGSACSHNPVPVVLPCHRVVRSDGSLGQYLGGVEAKAALLALEGASPG
jgi:methylated-DNA-[protein]-cysteine S-methyltransferase